MDLTGGFSPTPPVQRSNAATPTPSDTPVPTIITTASTTESSAAALSTATPAAEGTDAGEREPTPQQTPAEKITLDQELANVMNGLGSFWGKVRKQSATALALAESQISTARADLSPLVSKARANLDQFSEATKAELTRLSEAGNAKGRGVMIGADGSPIIMDDDDDTPPKLDKGKSVDRPSSPSSSDPSSDPTAAARAFFSSLHLPSPDAISTQLFTLSTQLQTNLSTLRTSSTPLSSALALTPAQIAAAKTYLEKGEHFFDSFREEVSRLAKDAVVVVPGSEGEYFSRRERKREREEGRKDRLLRALRADVALLRIDPAKVDDEAERTSWARFLEALEEKGGLEGETFKAMVKRELEEDRDGGEGLTKALGELVPTEMEKDTFWARYAWRRELVEEEDSRRRRVLEVAGEDNDDFTWDLEDEEDDTHHSSHTALTPSPSIVVPTTPSKPNSSPDDDPTPRGAKSAPVETSPTPKAESEGRPSSDGDKSYDIVGEKSGEPSTEEEEGGGEKDKGRESGEDSDWE